LTRSPFMGYTYERTALTQTPSLRIAPNLRTLPPIRSSALVLRRLDWLGVLVAVVLAGCRGGFTSAPLAVEEVAYVGDAPCASCHATIAAAYGRTGHGRSFSRFNPAAAPEQFNGTTVRSDEGYVYDAFVRGDTLFQRERRYDDGSAAAPTHELVYPAAYVVGSGRATRSYIMDVGGHLTEMPLTWYAERKIWDLSPGYYASNARFDRPISRTCLTCHNALPAYSEGTQNHYGTVGRGITCERCHGPASAHVAERQAGRADSSLVRLSRLDVGRQMAVCQQCHLEGTIVFKTGKTPASFRPGMHLSETQVVYNPQAGIEDSTNFGLGSHAARLAQSACFKAEAITCTTCHDPHRPVAETGGDAINNACRSCHAPAALAQAVPKAVQAQHTASSACWSCHMQAAGTSDIPHVTFTDHWIRKRLPAVRASVETAVRRNTQEGPPVMLVRMLDVGETATQDPAEAALEEGLAYYEVWETQQRRPEHADRVRTLVRQALAGGATSPQGYVALGRVQMADSLAAAEAVFRQGVGAFPQDIRLAYWHATALRQLGRPAEAIPMFQAVLQRQPRFLEARFGLGDTQQDAGQATAAEASYRALVSEDPIHYPGVWNNLGLMLLMNGRAAEALDPLRRAVALDPLLVEALVNLGGAQLQQGDLAVADATFRRALRLQPDNTSALANRGVIAMQQGRRGEAIALFREVVRLNPNDARAQQMLVQLEAGR